MIHRFEGRELDAQELRVLSQIEKHGWSVTNILEQDGDPGWSFTIGLFEHYGHPEVIIFGMSAKGRHSILNWIGKNVKAGKPFTAPQEHDWVLEGHNCWSREVNDRWLKDLAGWAVWFYSDRAFPMVQCIWPAEDGKYPWDVNSSAFLSLQPLLYENDVLAARMAHYASEESLTELDWPFSEDPHQRVFVSRCVVEDGDPIVQVVHDSDGDWQFIGPVDDPDQDGGRLSCFHCVVERDATIRLLARLQLGWRATRESAGSLWHIERSACE